MLKCKKMNTSNMLDTNERSIGEEPRAVKGKAEDESPSPFLLKLMDFSSIFSGLASGMSSDSFR